MLLRRFPVHRRRGAVLVEAAIVYPLLLLLLIGSMTLGLGVFQFHQVASLAREGARWASVRGQDYEMETGNPAATPSAVYDNVIQPMSVGLVLSKVTYSVTWSPSKAPGSYVTVTVNYPWVLGYFAGTLRSTAKQMVSF